MPKTLPARELTITHAAPVYFQSPQQNSSFTAVPIGGDLSLGEQRLACGMSLRMFGAARTQGIAAQLEV